MLFLKIYKIISVAEKKSAKTENPYLQISCICENSFTDKFGETHQLKELLFLNAVSEIKSKIKPGQKNLMLECRHSKSRNLRNSYFVTGINKAS